MGKNRSTPKTAPRRGEAARAEETGAATPAGLPCDLHHIDQSCLPAMAPGDLYVFNDAGKPSRNGQPAFFGVLACPLCGTPSLITLNQYCGSAPVICRSEACPALFRIEDEHHFVYLPVV